MSTLRVSARSAILAVIAALIAGAAAGVLAYRAASQIRAARSATALQPPPYGLPDSVIGELALVVLAGQSNMSGYGELDTDNDPHPRAFAFGNDYRWRLAREPLDSHYAQVDTISRDGAAGVGPGLAFAKAFLDLRPDLHIGLIPCAKGASSIMQWRRNMSDQSLYGSCIKRVRAASTAGRLAAILFFQGEADALDPSLDSIRKPAGATYGQEFSRFVSDFRDDLGSPAVPFIFAQLGTHTAPEAFINWDVIKAQQRAAVFHCAVMVVSEDLPLMDGVHYTTSSYRRIGTRFALALDSLLTAEPSCGVVEAG